MAEGSYKYKRNDKDNFQGCTIYIPVDINAELTALARSQGVTKAAYIISAIQTQIKIDKGEISSNGEDTAIKQFQELESKTDEIITDLKMIKKLLTQ